MIGLRIIKEYWVIILSIVALIIAWTNLNNTSYAYSDRLTSLEQKVEVLNKDREKMAVQINTIENDVKWIRSTLSKVDLMVQ